MIRRCPLTWVVSLRSAFVLSSVWALATIFSVALTLFALNCDRYWAIASSTSRWAYHTARNGWPAKARIAVR